MLGMNKSIFRRLLFSYLFIFLIGLGIVGLLTSYFVKGYIYNNTEEDLIRKAKRVNLQIQDQSSPKEIKKLIVFLDESFNTRIWIFDKNGKIISTSTSDEVSIGKSVAKSIVERTLKGENVITELNFDGLDEPMLSVVVPWGKDDVVHGGIVLHSPIVGLNHTVGAIRETLLWAILIGVLLSTAMVSYLSWSISKPLYQIDRAAAEIGIGNYKKRIHVSAEDEIGDLANTINRMAEKLEKIDDERKTLDQIRKDFLANVSHELRTPLTAMQGFLEALQDDLISDDKSIKKYYDVMYKETMHMNRLIDDLMDLIKLENKEIALALYPIAVLDLMNKVGFKFKQEISEKGIDLNITIDKNIPKVHADSDRLEQILDNLVKNAVKFTDKGLIDISVKPDNEFILFIIKDTGIGISKTDQELIWERFFKVDRGRSKKNMGTGLGLAIVKELIQLHQGKIEVNSELGMGTTFKVWIPAIKEVE